MRDLLRTLRPHNRSRRGAGRGSRTPKGRSPADFDRCPEHDPGSCGVRKWKDPSPKRQSHQGESRLDKRPLQPGTNDRSFAASALLDEVGLASGLRLFLEGFEERSKIKVALEIPNSFSD